MPTENKDQDDLTKLKERALSATSEGITIADARLPDQPIIYANAGFEQLTGYPPKAVIGRNCRFLQGSGTRADTVAEIRRAIDAEQDCTVEILNYKKDGAPFWNRLSITPVKDPSGTVTHFIGVQSDVTERRRAADALRKALKELERDLELAARIQQSLLPDVTPSVPGLEVSWRFSPCTQLAGDFLNVFPLDEDRTGLYILDVSGHGASAALLSVTLSKLLSPEPGQSCLYEPAAESDATGFTISRPARVAELLNAQFQTEGRRRQYFTLIYGVFDRRERSFRYVAAGHPGPVQVQSDGSTTSHGSTAPPIGLLDEADFEENALELAPGERVYLYTDGVTEARSPRDEELGIERLTETLVAEPRSSVAETLDRVVQSIERWQGTPKGDDDVSILGFRVVG